MWYIFLKLWPTAFRLWFTNCICFFVGSVVLQIKWFGANLDLIYLFWTEALMFVHKYGAQKNHKQNCQQFLPFCHHHHLKIISKSKVWRCGFTIYQRVYVVDCYWLLYRSSFLHCSPQEYPKAVTSARCSVNAIQPQIVTPGKYTKLQTIINNLPKVIWALKKTFFFGRCSLLGFAKEKNVQINFAL